MKKRRKKLDKGTETRRLARNSGLVPGATRVVEDKRGKPPKHKQRLESEERWTSTVEPGPDRT